MRRRGRPLSDPAGSYPNRVLAWRVKRGLTQEALGALVGLDHRTVGKIEKARQGMSVEQLQIFARALDVAPENLLVGGPAASLPLRYTVRGFEAEGGPAECARPFDYFPAPARLAEPEACFAVTVDDDSADRLYPAGSTLIVRKLARPAALRAGQKVLVRRFVDRRDQETMEVLVGILQRGALGDIEVSLRTNNRRLAGSVPVRRSGVASGLSERYADAAAPADGAIDYVPLTGDDAEILGVVAMAITPE